MPPPPLSLSLSLSLFLCSSPLPSLGIIFACFASLRLCSQLPSPNRITLTTPPNELSSHSHSHSHSHRHRVALADAQVLPKPACNLSSAQQSSHRSQLTETGFLMHPGEHHHNRILTSGSDHSHIWIAMGEPRYFWDGGECAADEETASEGW
ncbi:hypothetical protein M758_11G163300 [Ceratodon purpureus]|nr:hypothetical protein M758_11G163300 [Ceratodon purpureus]